MTIGGNFGFWDAAIPFWGATHAVLAGGEKAYNWVADEVGSGGEGDFKPYSGGDPAAYQYGGSPGVAGAMAGRALNSGGSALGYGQDISNNSYNVAQQYANRQGPQGNWAQQNGALGQANGLGGQLAGLEAQQGPSAAQAQLQQGTNQAMSSQLAMARSGRGFGGGAGASGLAQGNMAGLQANQANASASLAAQEQAAWRGRQASNLGNAASIQSNIASQYGQQGQADLGANLQTQNSNDAAALGWAGLGTDAYFKGAGTNLQAQGLANDIQGQQMTGSIAGEDAKLRAWAAQNGYTLTQQQLADQKEAGYINAAASGLGMAATASDVRGKTEIARTDAPAVDFARAGSMVNPQAPDYEALDAAAAAPGYSYRYKDPGAPGAAAGPQYGPMAQDLAKTPAGATTVTKGPDGKLAIDTGRLALVNTSAISAQQQELDEIKRQIASFNAQPGAAYPTSSRGSF